MTISKPPPVEEHKIYFARIVLSGMGREIVISKGGFSSYRQAWEWQTKVEDLLATANIIGV